MKHHPLDFTDFIKLILAALDASNVDYMLGGAIASWAWGDARSTMDVDLVANIPLESIHTLSEELRKRDMLVPKEIILDNILEDRADIPINAIHIYTGYKADIYPLRSGDELRSSALNRKILIDLGPDIGQVYLHSPEDLIIYKFYYYNLSQQTKHLRDITAILLSQKDRLDFEYILNWMEKKGLQNLWDIFLHEFRTGTE